MDITALASERLIYPWVSNKFFTDVNFDMVHVSMHPMHLIVLSFPTQKFFAYAIGPR